VNKFYLILLILGVTACSKQEALKVYTLKTPKVAHYNAKIYHNKTIKVMYPQSLKESISQKMLYSYSSIEKGEYENAEWSNNMAKLLEGTFIQTLDQSRLFKAVISYTSTATEDYRLESTIIDLSHHVRGRSSYAVVSIRFSLIDASKSVLVKTKRFDYRVATKTTNAKGYVDATNTAMAKLDKALVAWLYR